MIFNLTCSAIPSNAKVAAFRGSERLSTPYQFDIFFSIDFDPMLPLDIDLSDAVYSKAKIAINLGNEPEFFYSGILAAVRLVRAGENAALFHARLVPQLWQLTLTKHSRIWTKKSITDIITEVLDEAGIAHEFRPMPSLPTEEHVSQYKESDLAFISRWMEREGLYYFFEQTDDGDVMIITHQKATHTSLRETPVKYWPQNDPQENAVKNSFDNFAATHNALPARVKLIDYDYARPLLDVSSTVAVEANATGEIAEYGGRFFGPEDAQRLTQIRAEEQLIKKTTFYATGAASELSAGYKFSVEGHPMLAYNMEYLCVNIEHYGYDAQFGPAWGKLIEKKYSEVYKVEIGAVPAETQYRHGLVTPWPRIDGYENAVVDGPATSIYAQIDEQGRYAVKFKYDEGTFKDGKASTYVRMTQPHGGPQEGFHFPLRKGVEVICSFLGGDPDRPVIVGVVHNQLNQSVVTQNNYTQNIIRTGSLNHIVMEDNSGAMYIDIYCPIFISTLFLGSGTWNFNLTTQGCGQIQTVLNLNIDVDQWWTVDVVNYTTWDFHNTHKWNIELATTWKFNNTFTWEVTAAVDIDWNATLDLYVKASATLKFDNLLKVDIAQTNSWHIVGHETYIVDGGRDLTISSGDTIIVNGTQNTTINGSQIVHITGSQTVTIDAPITENYWAIRTKHIGGISFNTFVGLKTDIAVGGALSVFVGLKTDIQIAGAINVFVGVKLEAKLAAELSLNIGVFINLVAGLKLAVTAIDIGLVGVKIGAAGVGMDATGLKISATGFKADFGGIDIKGKILALFL